MHDLSRGAILVTGGAGLIGSALICRLNELGYENIIVVDRLDETAKWKHLVPLHFADYTDADDLAEMISDPAGLGSIGTVFHLGACSATTEIDADYLMRNNYDYTKRLAKWALDIGARFIYASSAATYGAIEDELCETADLGTLRPLNMYAYSKHLFDLYAARSGIAAHVAGIKYFNVFGPNEDHKAEMRSIVFKAFDQITGTGSVRLFKSYRPRYADGEQQRDFLYVKDAVDMTIHVARSGIVGIVNVGSGERHTWLDMVRPIFSALQLPERVEFIDMPAQLRDKYQYSTCAKMERLHDSGYTRRPRPLEEAVRDYVTRYLVPGRVLDPADTRGLSALSVS
ncbi:MAG: ADP-glyceromanno-heptose 6-epimerase [Candidatus Eremiobacteraeota bacterium]|nr:ADP-glyceromanno-heptose 6-epimerase [Candidatus Eremiobacteraeota bacterium]